MHENKRISPRFSFSEPVSYGLPDIFMNGSVAGNISLSGISLKVQEFVPVGKVMDLQISTGQLSKVLWAKAQVVRVRQVLSEDCYEIGLKFIVEKTSVKAIGDCIDFYRYESR